MYALVRCKQKRLQLFSKTVSADGAGSLRYSGNEFQADGPDTEKARLAKELNRLCETSAQLQINKQRSFYAPHDRHIARENIPSCSKLKCSINRFATTVSVNRDYTTTVWISANRLLRLIRTLGLYYTLTEVGRSCSAQRRTLNAGAQTCNQGQQSCCVTLQCSDLTELISLLLIAALCSANATRVQ